MVEKVFLVDLESVQHKLSSDKSLNTCYSSRFSHIDGPSFSSIKVYRMSIVERSLTFSLSGILLAY